MVSHPWQICRSPESNVVTDQGSINENHSTRLGRAVATVERIEEIVPIKEATVIEATSMTANYRLHGLDFIVSITVEGFRWLIYLAVVAVFE